MPMVHPLYRKSLENLRGFFYMSVCISVCLSVHACECVTCLLFVCCRHVMNQMHKKYQPDKCKIKKLKNRKKGGSQNKHIPPYPLISSPTFSKHSIIFYCYIFSR